MTIGSLHPRRRAFGAFRFLQPQDLAWVIFVAILILTAPERNNDALILLPLICAFQIVEPRLEAFNSRRGQIASITLKMVLCYLLVGYTDALLTYYYPIFLIPVVSAATILELPGVIIVTVLAAAAYFSFLLPMFWDYAKFDLPPGILSLLSLRTSFYAIVAFLVYHQAKAKRDEMTRTQEAAEQLAESNKNLREVQASLRRSERLAALGQLTAGLAHELRNPLGTIKASAEMLMKGLSRSQPELIPEMTGYILTEADRMSGLISSFLDFAKPLQIHPAEANLRLVVEDVIRSQTDLALSRDVKLLATTDEDLKPFAFDPDLLRLALSNLVQNAIQASSAGKEVETRISVEGANVRLLVSDHGEGIQPQHLENIFNPFFTTKPQGVGLGLAIVSKIVDEHHGRIRVFSEPGAGTTFEITLPKEQQI